MDKSILALLAGARAIESNKRLSCAAYVYDIFGSAQEISYYDAAKLLRDEAERQLAIESQNDLNNNLHS